jgi:hypothetical protein
LANFAVVELVEVAASIDESFGFSAAVLRSADRNSVIAGKDFETQYRRLSVRRPPSLKGEEWGRALARYAIERPARSDDGRERPFWRQLRAAVNSWNSSYDAHREHCKVDPPTVNIVDLLT